MRPLAELDCTAAPALFADVDDTLTWEGALVPEAYAGLCALVEEGLPVGIATGRPGGWAEVLAALWPVAFVVAENGGYAVLRDGTRVFWDGEAERAEQRRRLQAIVDEARATLPFAHLAEDADLRRVDVAFDVHERQDLTSDQIEALADLCRRHGARVLVSSIHLHAYYGDHDKAAMLLRLARERLGLDEETARARCLFVGDSPNDQAGFAAFARSVGVANVARHLHRLAPPPAFVTTRPGGHGFAELAAHLLSQRASRAPR